MYVLNEQENKLELEPKYNSEAEANKHNSFQSGSRFLFIIHAVVIHKPHCGTACARQPTDTAASLMRDLDSQWDYSLCDKG